MSATLPSYHHHPDSLWLASPLGQWMMAHVDSVAESLYYGRSWASAARGFARSGLLDLRGRAPSAVTAEETWRRVLDRTFQQD
ncbi:hypothetical protein [Roseococcus sp. YIM B11640]|uniref:hypothetical protein n=1 Tax=Roseococcus sp. YIM B11640 TaxID=3133973 RepID=UPI003C7E927D